MVREMLVQRRRALLGEVVLLRRAQGGGGREVASSRGVLARGKVVDGRVRGRVRCSSSRSRGVLVSLLWRGRGLTLSCRRGFLEPSRHVSTKNNAMQRQVI